MSGQIIQLCSSDLHVNNLQSTYEFHHLVVVCFINLVIGHLAHKVEQYGKKIKSYHGTCTLFLSVSHNSKCLKTVVSVININ